MHLHTRANFLVIIIRVLVDSGIHKLHDDSILMNEISIHFTVRTVLKRCCRHHVWLFVYFRVSCLECVRCCDFLFVVAGVYQNVWCMRAWMPWFVCAHTLMWWFVYDSFENRNCVYRYSLLCFDSTITVPLSHHQTTFRLQSENKVYKIRLKRFIFPFLHKISVAPQFIPAIHR